jgi:EmrB/QacA subfamily drug resistance transporter
MRLLPWLIAVAFFMESLDTTILNTAVPTIASALHVAPLSMKSVLASYTLSLAVFIPISGWMADRFGTRRVFASAIGIFTLGSFLCGISSNIHLLVACRLLQGCGGSMMVPVGRLTIVRTFDKSDLVRAMSFVSIPALIGPMLGPIAGGLIVGYLHWRVIFFVNIPIGLFGLLMVYLHLPDYREEHRNPLDLGGLILFGSGIALLSYVLEVFGEHTLNGVEMLAGLAVAILLLAGYGWHATRARFPMLRLSLFRIRTFRSAVNGNFLTRLGIGGIPFLFPLLYQIGLGLTPIQSGLLMMPQAIAAMSLKMTMPGILAKVAIVASAFVVFLLTGMNAPEVRAEMEHSRKGEALAQTISRGRFSRALIKGGQLRWRILMLVVLLGAIAFPLRTAFMQVAGEAVARNAIQEAVKDLLPPGALVSQQVEVGRDSVAVRLVSTQVVPEDKIQKAEQVIERRCGRKTVLSVASIASQSELAELMQRFSTPSLPPPVAPESLEDIHHEVITRIQPVLAGIWPAEAPLVRTVRQYGCERDLNLWIVDSLRKPAEHIAHPASQSRATGNLDREIAKSSQYIQARTGDSPNEDSVQHDRCSVVKEAFPFHRDGEPLVNGHVLENREHRDRVCSGNNRSKNKCHENGDSQDPMESKARDHGCREHTYGRKQANWNKAFPQLAKLNLQAALKQKGREEDDQTDVGC